MRQWIFKNNIFQKEKYCYISIWWAGAVCVKVQKKERGAKWLGGATVVRFKTYAYVVGAKENANATGQ